MTTTPNIVAEAEATVRDLAFQLTRVRARECLCCYVARQLDQHGCDGTHRHAVRYRDEVAPRATALLQTLASLGACCCDCELFLNGYRLVAATRPQRRGDLGLDADDTADSDILPPCEGVRRGSVRPCENWRRIGRTW